MPLFEQLTAGADALAATVRGRAAAQAALDEARATQAPAVVIADRIVVCDCQQALVGERAGALAAAAGPHRALVAELVAACTAVLEAEEQRVAVAMDPLRAAQAAAALAPHEARRDAARAALKDAIEAAEAESAADDGDAEAVAA